MTSVSTEKEAVLLRNDTHDLAKNNNPLPGITLCGHEERLKVVGCGHFRVH